MKTLIRHFIKLSLTDFANKNPDGITINNPKMRFNTVDEMKVTIDRNGCISCGSCVEACPAVFKIDVDGKASITEQYADGGPSKGDIPGDAVTCTEKASDACPVDVIVID